MKTFILFLSFAFTIIVHGQSNQNVEPVSKWHQLYFIDSLKAGNIPVGLNANDIVNITVDNHYYDSAKKINGIIYITTRKQKLYNFLSVAEVVKNYIIEVTTPTVFMLDNEFIRDTAIYRIDSSYILNVQVLKAAEFEYLQNTASNLTIVKIKTKNKENLDKQKGDLDKQKTIWIRGKEFTTMR